MGVSHNRPWSGCLAVRSARSLAIHSIPTRLLWGVALALPGAVRRVAATRGVMGVRKAVPPPEVGAEATHLLWGVASAWPGAVRRVAATRGVKRVRKAGQPPPQVGAEATHLLWGMASAWPGSDCGGARNYASMRNLGVTGN